MCRSGGRVTAAGRAGRAGDCGPARVDVRRRAAYRRDRQSCVPRRAQPGGHGRGGCPRGGQPAQPGGRHGGRRLLGLHAARTVVLERPGADAALHAGDRDGRPARSPRPGGRRGRRGRPLRGRGRPPPTAPRDRPGLLPARARPGGPRHGGRRARRARAGHRVDRGAVRGGRGGRHRAAPVAGRTSQFRRSGVRHRPGGQRRPRGAAGPPRRKRPEATDRGGRSAARRRRCSARTGG